MTLRLYDDLAPWWPLLSDPAGYAEEAAVVAEILRTKARRPVQEVLELGSGGGNNAYHLKAHFRLTLTDLSAPMLSVSEALNPDCRHLRGDMRSLRLDDRFDGVVVHDAIMYMTTVEDLRTALRTAFVHLRPGGIALFVPDDVRETFRAGHESGGHDAPDGSGLRYLEWSWDPDPDDTSFIVDFAFLLREPDGSVTAVHDRHLNGLFDLDTWHRLLADAGFADTATIRESDDVGWNPRHLLIGWASQA